MLTFTKIIHKVYFWMCARITDDKLGTYTVVQVFFCNMFILWTCFFYFILHNTNTEKLETEIITLAALFFNLYKFGLAHTTDGYCGLTVCHLFLNFY